jgi:hypothetical protein
MGLSSRKPSLDFFMVSLRPYWYVLGLVSWGGMRLSPLGTSTANWPIMYWVHHHHHHHHRHHIPVAPSEAWGISETPRFTSVS